MRGIRPIEDASIWTGPYWARLDGRPDIKVLVNCSPLSNMPWVRTWIVQAQLSCAEGCPLESWSAE